MTNDQRPMPSGQPRLLLAWQLLSNRARTETGWLIIGRALLVIGLVLVALLPRVLDLGGFITDDEANFWLKRSEIFLQALQTGDYAATAISTHPGVTTMWLGSAGIVLRHTLRDLGIVSETPFPVLLALMRLPAALVHVAAIFLGYALLRGMLPARVAFLAALFWATDPFVIGYSRLLHVDALMGTFATLSLLAACSYWHHRSHPILLILSAVSAGLAVLSKSPGLALLPVIGLIAVTREPSGVRHEASPVAHYVSRMMPHASRLTGRFAVLALWLLVFVLTLIAVWPAVWASPTQMYNQLQTGVEAEGAQPHMTGNFFLGHEDPAPGPLFYPVAVALRLTPWTLLGLFLLLRRRGERPSNPPSSLCYRDLAILLLFCVLFIAAMSFFPKKFNRYLVPIFPTLDILAAAGWGFAIDDLRVTAGRILARLWLPLLTIIAIVNTTLWHPYYITYFNQALGGAQAGADTFSVGWGEGFDQVAHWLNQQPDITGVLSAAIMITTLNPYLRDGAQADTPRTELLPDKTGYVVVYIYQTQGKVFPPFNRFYPRATPVHTVRIHGVDYAWIYQVPPPVAQPHPATFGSSLHLRGFTMERGLQRGHEAVLKLFWQTRAAPDIDYWLFAHVIGADRQRHQQVDLPLPTRSWEANRYITTELVIPIPAELPTGPYQIIIGLYDPATGNRLPLETDHRSDPAIDGGDALLLVESEQ